MRTKKHEYNLANSNSRYIFMIFLNPTNLLDVDFSTALSL